MIGLTKKASAIHNPSSQAGKWRLASPSFGWPNSDSFFASLRFICIAFGLVWSVHFRCAANHGLTTDRKALMSFVHSSKQIFVLQRNVGFPIRCSFLACVPHSLHRSNSTIPYHAMAGGARCTYSRISLGGGIPATDQHLTQSEPSSSSVFTVTAAPNSQSAGDGNQVPIVS